MSILETIAIFVGIPVLAYAVISLVGINVARAGNKQVAEYRLGQEWTGAPILWTATDDVLHGDHSSHGRHSTPSIGASAHGTW